jgi:hypothetical protein
MTTPIPRTSSDDPTARIIERPDGFYWQSKETGEEGGPFPTLTEAVEDMKDNADSGAADAGEMLDDAEGDLGIADWIDPDTGLPAEDSVPRIEDH